MNNNKSMYSPIWGKLKQDRKVILQLVETPHINTLIKRIVKAVRKRRTLDSKFITHCSNSDITYYIKYSFNSANNQLTITLEKQNTVTLHDI